MTDTKRGFDEFTDFMRKLVQVPHSEIKAKIEADKEAKRASKVASRDSGASSSVLSSSFNPPCQSVLHR